ncbi:ribonuclease T2 [Lepidopterella palustris CBS 459.81]|uniref:Ribonuclease T2-like n=1 Tax=Lepidopterella palustris CBS 459.81 TaxID=1314670 RepID=A0A8E2JHR1_9PEZI|nr:ribonuclease T2 [Lepidopterella palustris CBS 459.81]
MAVLAAVEAVHNAARSALGVDPAAAAMTMASSIPSLRSLSKFALGGAQLLLGSASSVLGGTPESCSNPQLSCHNTTVVTDLCCFNAPGGQLLQTQFWDTSPSTGPSNSWTIHGLWPDHCDGTFDANCDANRAYTNITAILQSFGKTDLLNYMNIYWKDYQGNDETFWEHEWGKHGTCVSTLSPSCYTNYQPTEEAVDFFQKTVDLFQTLPSYDWLAAAGIVPSTTATYTSAAILAALGANRGGFQVTLGCTSGALDEIWYHYDVRGSVQTGDFVATDPDGSKSTCPSTGIQYLPKSGSPVSKSSAAASSTKTSASLTSTTLATSTLTSSSAAPSGTGTPGTFSGKGYLNVVTGGSTDGCIISAGTWYTSGTCATFTATASGSGFTLSSSKGKCAISSGALTCGSSVSTATVFTALNGDLAYSGSTTFYATSVPSGSTQATVYTTSKATSLVIAWQQL